MAITPQIVHVCDHILESIEKGSGVINIKHTHMDNIDNVEDGIVIRKIYSVYEVVDESEFEHEYFYEGSDFNLIGGRRISWTGNKTPINDYFIECHYTRSSIDEYSDDECPRCTGNGWYVDLLPQSEVSVNKLTGMNKIVQDFIKILFTYRLDGQLYGSKLADYTGVAINNPDQVCSEVASIIYAAANQYKDLQMSSVIDGNNLYDDEILNEVVIDEIEYDIGYGGIYVVATLYSAAGESRGIGIGS